MARACLALVLLLTMTAIGVGSIYEAEAAVVTYTVTKTADTNDGTCNADCSLREAITAANAHVNIGVERDVINFNISGTGTKVISPTTPLPVISGPVEIDGLTQPGASCTSHRVILVQLDGSGAAASDDGLTINYASGGSSIIRGLSITNWDNGIEVLAESGHKIECNNIGIDASGSVATGNTRGIFISNATNVVVGGTASSQRNVISANGSGIFLSGSGSGSTISGNFIGTNEAGSAALGNSAGIVKSTYSSLTIGGTTAGARNVISGNVAIGINLQGTGSTNVFGNYIGYANNGTTLLANGSTAINTQNGGVGSGFVIGGVGVGQANKIYSPAGVSGVIVGSAGGGVEGVSIRGNQIKSETLGINIVPSGEGPNLVTANDVLDPDAGPNKVQNFPVLTSAISGSPGSLVGTLTSSATGSFTIDFYKGSTCGSAGDRDGETHLGSVVVVTNGAGSAPFNAAMGTFTLGDSITATATDASGNTSEFSPCVAATGQVPTTFTVNSTNDVNDGTCNATHCSLREAITAANGNNNNEVRDIIAFNIAGAGVKTITVGTTLPAIASPMTIDGTTQPGAACTDATRTILVEIMGQPAINNGLTISNVASPGVLVRGVAIGNFGVNGIVITSGADHNIECTNVGLDATGNTPRSNAVGISVTTAPGTLIGGSSPSKRNVVGKNTATGVQINSNDVTVRGNFIGSGPTGLGQQANGRGIFVASSANVVIGGTGVGDGNVINFNTGAGIEVGGTIGSGNAILGNLVGIGANQVSVQPNGKGVLIAGTTVAATPGGGVKVGGTGPGEANRIATGSGQLAVEISLTSPAISEGHAIRGNSIKTVNTIGIDLHPSTDAAGTVTANDAQDPDTGPNLRQNFPLLDSAVGGTPGTISGALNSTPNATFTLDFYSGGGTCGQPGTRDGETFLGSFQVSTDGTGNTGFAAPIPAGFFDGALITATATDAIGNTSEFSDCVTATAPPPSSFVVNTADDTTDVDGCTVAHCSLREAILAANANGNPAVQDVITFNIPGGGIKVINVATPLPFIGEAVDLQGETQPGASCLSPGRSILIEIRGPGTVSAVMGLTIGHSGAPTYVSGIALTNFNSYGLRFASGDNHAIRCSNIGIEADGQTARGNGLHGVFVDGGTNIQVGSDDASARNIIGANPGAGILMLATNFGYLAFNYIGVAGDGVTPRPNGTGILMQAAKGGGLDTNVIAGNTGPGIDLADKSVNVSVRSSLIGLGADGTTHLPNGGPGISIHSSISSSNGHQVGYTAPGLANTIYSDGQPGIEVLVTGQGEAINNPIRGNSITAVNGALGIALTPANETSATVTNNDNLDTDSGPNNLQNYPVLTDASVSPNSVSGTFNSNDDTEFEVDFFAGPGCGQGTDGERFLGTVSFTTNVAGNATFTANGLAPFSVGEGITAVATSNDGDSSEFSQCLLVVAPEVPKMAIGIGPGEAIAGTSTEVVVTVQGSGFEDGDQVTWDGVPVETTFVSATEMTFVATPDLIGDAQAEYPIGIVGGTSNQVFTVLRSSSDVNCSGTADATDALYLMQVIAGILPADGDCSPDADKSGGAATVLDVLHIRREIAKLLEPLESLFQ